MQTWESRTGAGAGMKPFYININMTSFHIQINKLLSFATVFPKWQQNDFKLN